MAKTQIIGTIKAVDTLTINVAGHSREVVCLKTIDQNSNAIVDVILNIQQNEYTNQAALAMYISHSFVITGETTTVKVDKTNGDIGVQTALIGLGVNFLESQQVFELNSIQSILPNFNYAK